MWLASSLIAAWAAVAQTRFDPLVAGGVVLAISLGFPLLTVPTKSSRLVLLGAGLSYPIYLLSHKVGNVVQAASGSVIMAILVVLAMAYLVTLAEPSGKAWIKRIGNILGARLGFTRSA